jgi:ribosome-interacting GTPase 1
MEITSGSLLIGFDFSKSSDTSVLIVGKQKKGKIEIINAIQGKEAEELYTRLTTRPGREKKDELNPTI